MKININNPKQAILEYPDVQYHFSYQAPYYQGILGDAGDILTINPKEKNVLMVTWVDKAQKNYQTVLYRQEHLILPQQNKRATRDFNTSSTKFVGSYHTWHAADIARGYDLLSYKEQGMMRLYPYVSSDVASRMCQNAQATAGIFKLLQNQQLDCEDLVHGMQNMSESKKKIFTHQLQREKNSLQQVYACGQGVLPPSLCQKVTKDLADRSLQIKSMKDIVK